MNCCEIDYKIKTASCEVIFEHLDKCKNNFDPPLQTYVDIQKYAEKIDNKAITFEAWVDNTLAGLLAAYFNDENGILGYITTLSVLNEYQGLGIGEKLFMLSIEYGKEHNFKIVRLEANYTNQKGIKFYKRIGFVETIQNEHSVFMDWLL